MALSLALRWRTLWASYWGDEAIAIGIAVHPISALPHYLVNDGSPPLYYVMLHYWMLAFGRSEPATHALSMVPALGCIPAAWWSGTRLFGRWAGRAAAALVATCAYLDYYSTETRMYSWLVLAAICCLTCFVLAYRGAGLGYWAAAVALGASVAYLQYYGLYFLAAIVVVGCTVAGLGAPGRTCEQACSMALPVLPLSAPGSPNSSTSSTTPERPGRLTLPPSISSVTRSTPSPRPDGQAS